MSASAYPEGDQRPFLTEPVARSLSPPRVSVSREASPKVLSGYGESPFRMVWPLSQPPGNPQRFARSLSPPKRGIAFSPGMEETTLGSAEIRGRSPPKHLMIPSIMRAAAPNSGEGYCPEPKPFPRSCSPGATGAHQGVSGSPCVSTSASPTGLMPSPSGSSPMGNSPSYGPVSMQPMPAMQQPQLQQGMQQPLMPMPMQQPSMQQSPQQHQPMVPQPMQQPLMQPPAMQPPAMQPPAMQPPAMQPPAMQPPAMQPPAMQPPAMQPPAMQPPAMQQQMQQPVMQQPMQQPMQQLIQQPVQQATAQQPQMQQTMMQPPMQPLMQQPAVQQVPQIPMQQAMMQQPVQQANVQPPHQQPMMQPGMQQPAPPQPQMHQPMVAQLPPSAQPAVQPAQLHSMMPMQPSPGPCLQQPVPAAQAQQMMPPAPSAAVPMQPMPNPAYPGYEEFEFAAEPITGGHQGAAVAPGAPNIPRLSLPSGRATGGSTHEGSPRDRSSYPGPMAYAPAGLMGPGHPWMEPPQQPLASQRTNDASLLSTRSQSDMPVPMAEGRQLEEVLIGLQSPSDPPVPSMAHREIHGPNASRVPQQLRFGEAAPRTRPGLGSMGSCNVLCPEAAPFAEAFGQPDDVPEVPLPFMKSPDEQQTGSGHDGGGFSQEPVVMPLGASARTFTSSERSRAKDQEIRELERKLSEANRRNEQLEGQAQLAARQKELLAEQQAEVDDLQQQLLQSKHRAEQMEADALEALTAERRMKLEAREQAQLVANQSEQMAHQHAEEMAQQAATLAELHARLAVQQQAESMRQAWGNGSGPVAWAAPSFTEALRDHKAKVREAELKASVKSNEERNFSLQHDLEATRALAAKTTAEHLASQRSNEAAAEAASLQTLQLQEELREAQAELQRQKSQLEEEREKLKREREGHQDKHHSHLQELHGELHRERQHLTTAHDACHTEHQQLLSSARQELEEERRKHAESKEGTKSQLLQHVRHIGSLEGKVTGLSTEANFLKGRISELQGILKESETHMVKQGQVIASLKKELEKAKGETGRTRSEGEERLYQMRREGTRRLQERVEQLSAKPSGCLPRLGPSRHGSRSGSCGSGLGLKARS